MKGTILIVDDDAAHLRMLQTVLGSLGHAVIPATDGSEAIGIAGEKPCDLILMDVRMTNVNGIEALRRIKAINPAIPVVIMTAYSSVDTAVEAMKLGAYDYLTKPLNFEEMKLVIERAMEHLHLALENRSLKQKMGLDKSFAEIIGSSRAMEKVVEMARIVAPTEATVLITGESGTGKELFAKAIHANSERGKGPLVTVNCAALTETLLESELFGHEKGTFTGADRQRNGRFVQAHKGTIFLDEVGEIPLAMQAKILRAIQEREIQRLGSDEVQHVDVRIIAATNRNLEEEVRKGTFREDLFYRLNVMNIHIPPLRQRMTDISLLAQHFLQKYVQKNRKEIKGFSPAAMDVLTHASWPGNVRELENVVERAVILAMNPYISEKDLPQTLTAGSPVSSGAQPAPGALGGKSLEEIESQAIKETLEKTEGNKSEAAKLLNITRTTLNNKLKKYNILS
ncbi:sigma-54-dependent transcriptional regulator [Desulfobulbus elongatus]|uniref:sigma-54-dependent transcriptional regulator n=1 Tax=Desulfobulbus elongatus TaxID=53332 RepID=UPI000486741F|nr:sigma-54 dependent transcriptional regulator [Desulfobulbus elongatus]